MRAIAMIFFLSGIGLFGYLAAQQMSSDGIAMAIGLLSGIMATIPGMMMVAASQRRTDSHSKPQQAPRVVYVSVEQYKAPETWHVVPKTHRTPEIERLTAFEANIPTKAVKRHSEPHSRPYSQ